MPSPPLKFVSRPVVVLLLALAVVATTTLPVAAQDEVTTTAPTTSAPPTTAPPTTSPSTTPPTTGPTTTVPSGGGGDSSTTVPSEGSESTDLETTTTIDPDNPLEAEGPAETVPEVTVTVPPRSGGYAGQPDFKPTEVLWGNVRQAEKKLAAVEEEHRQAVAQVKSVRLRVKELQARVADLDLETQATLDALALAEERLELRALSAFVRADSFVISPSLDHDEILDSMAQQTMVESVFEQDEAAMAEFQALRESLDGDTLATFERIQLLESIETSALERVDEQREAIGQAELELRAFRAGSEVFIDGIVFPIDGDVELPLIDSYGFARMTGTPDEHWHEGIDIFAPTGTPLVATERGVVTNIGTGRLGGLRLWLRGESGTDWYYAHLSSFAAGLTNGQVVEAGDLLGYVGTSGNAVGTPPHLHMQMHPGGNRPVNPYPLLQTVIELAQEAALADQR